MEIIIKIKVENSENVKVEVERDETESESKKNHSDYARFFDETCSGWSNDAESNLMFLRVQENWLTDKLKRQGYLFLNDAYETLGMPKTKIGQMVGWVFEEKNPIGDNRVDFGIFDEANKSFVNGYEKSILLDFNVDGNILDRI